MDAVAGSPPPPVAVEPPADRVPPRGRRAPRWSAGHVLMLVAGLTAAVGTWALLRAADATVPVAVAATPLRAGQPVAPADFDFVSIHADEALLATLLAPGQIEGVAGWVATTAVEPGELVSRGMLRSPAAPAQLRAMSVPVAAERAAGGALAAGDRIDVIEVRGGIARYVASDLQVLAVGQQRSGLAGAVTAGGFAVVVAVDDADALRLAAAIDAGGIHVVRATGAGRTAQQPYDPAASLPAPADRQGGGGGA